MKAGFFVMKTDEKFIISPEYEMMEEFFQRTGIDFTEKVWNVNFWDFQTRELAETFVVGYNSVVNRPISIMEHCRRESGLSGQALKHYVNKHYGHN